MASVKYFKVRMTKDNRKVCEEKLKEAVMASLQDIGDAVLRHIAERVPRDTGDLLNSYLVVVHDTFDDKIGKVEIGSSLEYAPYVELGTGPNYEKPPKWVTNNAERGHHLEDPWWYMGKDGEWHRGWFIHSQPHLRPAIIGHSAEYKRIFKNNLQNA